MKKLMALTLAAAMAVCGTGTVSVTAEEQPTEFTMIATQPNTLNMILSASNLDSYCFYLTQEMLFRPYNGVYEPEVVDTWEADDTNTVYTYHLKETSWADGTPITAADFAYFITSRLDPNSGSSNAAVYIDTYHILNAAAYNSGECELSEVGVKALDDLTLEITLDQPVADFDGTNIEVYPLSEAFVQEQGEALGGTPENYMCSGPYVLTEWVFDSYLTYEKNPGWIFAEEQFPTDKVTMIQAQDMNTSVSMFEGGEADVLLTVGADYLDILQDSLTYYPFSAIRAVQLNVYGQGDEAKAALLSNKNFRMALSYAIDREAVNHAVNPIDTAINRYMSAPMSGNQPDSLFEEDYPVETVPMNGDADAAKEYLQAALDELGYASVDELPELSYLCFENEDYRLMGETLVSQWNQILGLNNITIELKPIPDAIQQMMSYQYDMYYTALSNGQTPSEFMNYWITGGSVNDVTGSGMSLFSNEEYDSLIAQATTEFDREKRMSLYAQAEQILLDEAPLIMINTSGMYTAIADGVEGFMYNTYDSAIELNHLVVNR